MDLLGVVESMYRQQGPEPTEALIRRIESNGVVIPTRIYNFFLYLYGKTCRIRDMERWYHRLRRASTGFPHQPISKIKDGTEGTRLSSENVTAGASSPVKAGSQQTPPTPNIYTFTLLIDGYNRAGHIDKVIAVWRDFEKSGLAINQVFISVLLDALGYHHQSQLLVQFWNTLQQGNVAKLTENNFNSYLEALCRMGNFEKACQVFTEEMWPPPKTARKDAKSTLPRPAGKRFGKNPSHKTLVTLLTPLQIHQQTTILRQVLWHVRSYYPSSLETLRDIMGKSE
ncbi:hypothetical protein IWQ62_002857 [Dispira parvispora]|uniref:Pentatricopeptide repeat-containing protein n=1 Tax=Dispira parvispora TaxID=1520584 RepID=A0A9W8APN3_9FUNG|nr:hypothetical protein IWQ62_002857 [Dispira parvispora]